MMVSECVVSMQWVCVPGSLEVHELHGGAVGGRLAVVVGRGARQRAAGLAGRAARQERRLLLAAAAASAARIVHNRTQRYTTTRHP